MSERYAIHFSDGTGAGYLYVGAVEKEGANAQAALVYEISTGKIMIRKSKWSDGVRSTLLPDTEINIMNRLRETGTIPRIQSFRCLELTTGRSQIASAIMEYCDAGTLVDYAEKYTNAQNGKAFAWNMLDQVLDRVEFLTTWEDERGRKIRHSDLHAGNIFLKYVNEWTPPQVLIGDFGAADLIQPGQWNSDIYQAMGLFEIMAGPWSSCHSYFKPLTTSLDEMRNVLERKGLMALLRSQPREEIKRKASKMLMTAPRFPKPYVPQGPIIFESSDINKSSTVRNIGKPFRWVRLTGREGDFTRFEFLTAEQHKTSRTSHS